jgi:hypothetical protein
MDDDRQRLDAQLNTSLTHMNVGTLSAMVRTLGADGTD